MTDRFKISKAFFSGKSELVPKNAVAAIILDERQRLLVQLRDDKEEIFFPNHWGCFGGAIEAGESPHDALVRELSEELGITFDNAAIERFISISFNPKVDAGYDIGRHFYLVKTISTSMQPVRLNEGSAFDWMTYEQLMQIPNVTPYDKFGIWLYFNQPRMAD